MCALRVVNLSALISNYLLSNKSIKIQDSCLLGPLDPTTKSVGITLLAILSLLVLSHTWQKSKLIIVTPWGINSINLMIHGLAESILKMASVDIELPELHTTHIMTSSNGNIFCVTGPLSGEFTGYRWIPRTKASDASLLMFPLICDSTSGWVNNQEAGDLRGHRAHYAAIVMQTTASEVHASVVAEWPPACLHELLPKDTKMATEENLKWKTFPTWSVFVPQNPFRFETYMEFLNIFVPFKLYFWHEWKKSMLVLGPHGKDKKCSRDKANICNK